MAKKKKRTSHKSRNIMSWVLMLGYTALVLFMAPYKDSVPVFYLIGMYFASIMMAEIGLTAMLLIAAHGKEKQPMIGMRSFRRAVVGRQRYIRSAILWAALSYTGHVWIAAMVALVTVLPIIAVIGVPAYHRYRLNKVKT